MKSILAILTLTWTAQTSTRAEADPRRHIEVKGGPSITTTTDDSSLDLHDRHGFSGGLAGYHRWFLADQYSLSGQIEILYSPRGARFTFEDELIAKSRLNYFDVIVAARPEARLGPAGIYLLLGGGLNFLMSAAIENDSGMKKDIIGDLHRIDVALLAAAGIAWHLPRRRVGPFHLGTVFLEARHDHGLLDTDAVNGGFKNRTSSLMLGLSLALPSGSGDRSAGMPTSTR